MTRYRRRNIECKRGENMGYLYDQSIETEGESGMRQTWSAEQDNLWSFVDQDYSKCSASPKLFIMSLHEVNKE